jgi:hypothetical protein
MKARIQVSSSSVFTALAVSMLLIPGTVAQVQSTISCPAGYGYWDTLSVMMLDPGLATKYHMEGEGPNGPNAFIYTTWDQTQSKVWYVKNPQGYPWDINLYDYQPGIPQQGYVYQWVTEIDWQHDSTCKKFNNRSQSSSSDRSFPWAARCAVPGGKNGSFWTTASAQPYDTRFYKISNGAITGSSDLGNALLELKPTGTITLYDTRYDSHTNPNPPKAFSASTMPLQYTYTCYQENPAACHDREVFIYAVDTNVNPVDGQKHSYGWVQWEKYVNLGYVANQQSPNPENWVPDPNYTISLQDHLVAGQVATDFKCF